MSDFDMNQLKLKTAEQLDQDERDFIVENRDQLNEEDEAAYAEFLPKQEVEDDANITEDKPEEDEKSVEEESPEPVIKSQEDLDRYWETREAKLRAEMEEREAKIKEELTPKEEPKEFRFYEDGQKPADWNEALARAAEKGKQDAVAEFEKRSEEEKKEAAAKQKQLDEATAAIQDQFDKLVKDKSIPSLDTDEGKTAQQRIMEFGIKHRKNVEEAFDLLKDIPEDRGGFLNQETPQNKEKKQLDAQKKAAGKVGGGNKGGESTDTKPKLSPEEYARMSVQDVVEWGLEHR